VEEIKEKCLNPAIAALAELFLGQRESLGKDSELFYLKILEDLLDLGEYQIFANLHTAKKFFPDCLDKEIGDIFFKRQRWELALEQYREAFKNRSVSPELYLQAAKCLKNLNQIQASMELLLQAIEVFPDYFPNYYLLITICTESGKIDLLKYVVKKALEKFPESLWIKSLVA
jgi:tetratricopeptide (TPR) repeat protein